MPCRLLGAKPLSKPMLRYCQLDPREETSVKYLSKYKAFQNAPQNIGYEMAAILSRAGYELKAALSVAERIAMSSVRSNHDDVIKWKHFLCYWPFVRGIHRSPMNSPLKGQ